MIYAIFTCNLLIRFDVTSDAKLRMCYCVSSIFLCYCVSSIFRFGDFVEE